MRFRFRTRLTLAMAGIVIVTIAVMAVIVTGAALSTSLDDLRSSGITLTELAKRNVEYGLGLPPRVMERVGDQMVVSALLTAELVAIAERDAKLPPERISEALKRVIDRSREWKGYPLADEFWVTDETGRAYIHTEDHDFSFSRDARQAGQFMKLLDPGASPLVQRTEPRALDGQRFKYVGVSGVDRPRIVQVGVGDKLIKEIGTDFVVQNIVDRFFTDLHAERMLVVNRRGVVIARAAAAGEENVGAEDEAIEFCMAFLGTPDEEYQAKPFGADIGVATRLTEPEGDPEGGPQNPSLDRPQGGRHHALFIQFKTDRGKELVHRILIWFSVLTLIMTAGAALLSVIFSRGLSRPILALAEGARQIGGGNLNHRIQVGTGDEFEGLARSFNTMATSLQEYTYELNAEITRRERLESEMTIAADLQQSLLPEAAPRAPGLDIKGWCRPARQVGGDFYDFISMGPNRLGVAIGDATGKGLPSALLIAECWSVFKAFADEMDSPAALLERTNRALCKRVRNSGRFVTLFFTVIDTERRVLRYASAGHNPPFLMGRNPERRQRLTSQSGFPLGIDSECAFAETEVGLDPGDTVVLFSDGLTDARNHEQAFYGCDRLERRLHSVAALSLEDIMSGLRLDVDNYTAGVELYDDMTVVGVRFQPDGDNATRGERPIAGSPLADDGEPVR